MQRRRRDDDGRYPDGRLDPQAALSFLIENCSLTRLDYLSPHGAPGLWRVGAVNHRPWSKTTTLDAVGNPMAVDKA